MTPDSSAQAGTGIPAAGVPDQEADGQHDAELHELAAKIESVLFVAGGPVSADRLAEAVGAGRTSVTSALDYLRAHRGIGLLLQAVAGGYQLGTRPEHAEIVRRFLQSEHSESLTKGALEVLAIIAYRQPATRGDIEQIRGTRSDWHIERLLERQLIREAGRRPTIGRPMLFTTTELFLRYFGLRDLTELPPMGAGGVQALLDSVR
ncbi:MAG: SMC-Scp complex subunit ScpB [bacterium]